MKKLLAIAIASISVAAMADAVGYSPVVGVSEITATLQNTIVPVKFSSLVDATDIKAKDLVHPQGIPTGTWLYVFVNNSYMAFAMDNNGQWVAPSGYNSSTGFIAPDINQVAVKGTALWLIFPKNGDTVTFPTGNKFYIYGQVIDSPTSTIVAGTEDAPKYNLICNPTDADVAIASKLGGIPAAKDKISPIGETFSGEYVYTGSVWWYVNSSGKITKENVVLPTIPAGGGFWYISKGGSGNINWGN